MANNIDINIRANDQTAGILGKIGLAVGGIGGAIGLLTDFIKKSVSETEKYVTSITDMSRVLGMSTEETSRLVQASDNLFITQEKLNTALLTASRQGIDVSINGIKELSEEYLNLAPGVERAEFLIKKFGSSAGPDMGKLLEVGTKEIDATTSAIKDNLIVTNQSKINIENYKRSVDSLNDAWQGIKYTVGSSVIPQFDLFLRQLTRGVDEVEAYELKINDLNEQIRHLEKYGVMGGLSVEEMGRQVQVAKDEIDSLSNAFYENQSAAENNAAAILDMTNANKTMLSMAASFTSAQKNYEDGMKGVAESIAEANKNHDYWAAVVERAPYMVEALTKKLDELTAAGDTNSETFKETEEKLEDWENTLSHGPGYVQSLSDKVEEQKQKVIDLQKAHELATRQIILGYLNQKAMADGVLTDEEMAWLIEKGVAWGIYSETAVEEMNKVMDEWSNWDPEDKTGTFTIITQEQNSYGEGGYTGYLENQAGVDMNGNGIIGMATGGYAAGGPFLVGERGPELFTPSGGGQITPNNQLGGGGMSQSQMTQFAQIMSVALAAEVQKLTG